MMRGENGQALPLAILVLAIGSLVVTPFLGHASASLTGSRVYTRGLAELYAADAGVEHAIWSLTSDGLAESFTEAGDQVTYDLGEAINDLTVSVTITANVTPSGAPAGEIEDVVIDNMVFDSSSTSDPDTVHVAGDIYAVAYQGPGSDGFVKTISIANDGQINNSVIDTLDFDGSQGVGPDIIHIAGDIYAIAHQGADDDGFVRTVSIDGSGQISNSVIDTLEFDTGQGTSPEIIHISGDVYAIAYQGPGSDGFVRTMTINSSGYIGNSVIDTLEFDTSQGTTPDVIHVSGDVYAIAYQGPGSDGFVRTMTINSSGNIGNSTIDSLEFDTSQGIAPRIVHVSGDVYAIAYRGPGDDGYIRTVTIAANGYIGNSVIDSLEFDTSDGREPSIVQVHGDNYAVAYRGPSGDGFLKTVTIAAGGDVAGAAIDTLEYDTGDGYTPEIINISEGVFAIAYRGPSSRGYIKTVGIGTGVMTGAAYEIVAGAGDRAIRAFVNTSDETDSIVSWEIE